MTSLRAPKIFMRRPSQAELALLFGLSRSSRSTFSPSLMAQTCPTEAEAVTSRSGWVIRRTSKAMTPALVILFNPGFQRVSVIVVFSCLFVKFRGSCALDSE